MAHRIQGQLLPIGGGDPIPLIRESLVVGRLDSCDICLRLPNVSKRHCRLFFDRGFWWIEDLNSTNGVKVNNNRINAKKLLHPEDTVTVGKRTYTIDYDPPVGQSAIEDILDEEDIMELPLLEKAGLMKPQRYDRKPVNPLKRMMEEAERLDEED